MQITEFQIHQREAMKTDIQFHSKIVLSEFKNNIDFNGISEHTAKIKSSSFESILYFKIHNQENLNQPLQVRAEAFILAMLIPAMQAGQDLESDLAIDEELLYNLNTQLIPYLVSTNKKLKHIKIHSQTKKCDQEKQKNKLCILGMSCGLDALTAFAELNESSTPQSMRPQALIMNNIGAFGKGEEKFHHDRRLVLEFAKHMNLPLFMLESNMDAYYQSKYTETYSIRNAAAAWVLGDISRTTCYASGVEYKSMGKLAGKNDIGFLDPIIFPMMSTNAFQVYTSGFQHNRPGKFKIFLTHPELRPYLNTCLKSVDRKNGFINCGTCKKCSELIFIAAALNSKTHLQKNFNLSAFENKKFYLEFKLVYNANKRNHSQNSASTLACLRQHKALPSRGARIMGKIAGALSHLKAFRNMH